MGSHSQQSSNQEVAVGRKEFVRFSAFPIANSTDKHVLFETCHALEKVIRCRPIGKGYYSLAELKELSTNAMMRAHTSVGVSIVIAGLAAAAMVPVAGAVTLSGMLFGGVGGVVGMATLGAGLTVTNLYLFGLSPKISAIAGVPAGVLFGLFAATEVGAAGIVAFTFAATLPIAAGYKLLNYMGMNPVKTYKNGLKLRDLYQAASLSGSTDQILEVETVLKNLHPSAPFSNSQQEVIVLP